VPQIVYATSQNWIRILAGLSLCIATLDCGPHKASMKSVATGSKITRDANASDAGPDAEPMMTTKSRDGGPAFGFAALAVDASTHGNVRQRTAGIAFTIPEGWRCSPDLAQDAICDCGCGAADGACATLGCSTPGCSVPACQVCFDAAGEYRDCGAPGAWTCERSRRGDGVCDCGCGEIDPDCEPGHGCYEAGCNVEGCGLCHDGKGGSTCGTPPAFTCLKSFKGDGKCDCGCGNYDPDCKQSSCLEHGCDAPGCDVCHDAAGKPAACVAETPGFTCDAARRGDGVCDCGCGEVDPDCEHGAGCAAAGCDAQGCAVCHDMFGRDVPCAGSWTCDAARFADGVCDCGCGRADPDCHDQGCSDAGCSKDACELRHDGEGHAIRPESWTCKVEAYGTGDGCDCGCGAPDPDCNAGCTEPGCQAPSCDRCRLEGGALFECRWTCDLAKFGTGDGCDCGCGTIDLDCGKLSCYEPGCYADACERCFDSKGKEYACQRGACPAGYKSDGVCDCGCREDDPDCMSASSCVEPGCSADGCGLCHDASGARVRCEDWACGLEKQGGKDGCNCGCGAPDPDCAPDQGCSIAGCRADGCVTCRSPDGAPMSCAP
jgi:hypothetical protein